MLHGGWWGARYGLDLMHALCADLAGSGWLVSNVEYRRIGGDDGGWPDTFADVLSGAEILRAAGLADGLRTVAIGHSAGGHLALLLAGAGAVDAAVGLAPATDLERCDREGVGEGAAAEFIGASRADEPDTYRRASPAHCLPLGRPQLIVHGELDDRIPVRHSRDYAAAARAAGDPVTYAELPGTDHFHVIDPAHPSWRHTRDWLESAG